MDPLKEKTVGCMLAAGVVTMVVSLILAWVFAMAGVFHSTATREPTTGNITSWGDAALLPLTIVAFIVGLGLTGYSIATGIRYGRGAYSGPRQTVPNAHVIARYGVDRSGYILTQDFQIDSCDGPRYYVRLQLPEAVPAEFQCEPDVFYQCGEGMFGEAVVQGKWLGSFVPYIGVPPTI